MTRVNSCQHRISSDRVYKRKSAREPEQGASKAYGTSRREREHADPFVTLFQHGSRVAPEAPLACSACAQKDFLRRPDLVFPLDHELLNFLRQDKHTALEYSEGLTSLRLCSPYRRSIAPAELAFDFALSFKLCDPPCFFRAAPTRQPVPAQTSVGYSLVYR